MGDIGCLFANKDDADGRRDASRMVRMILTARTSQVRMAMLKMLNRLRV